PGCPPASDPCRSTTQQPGRAATVRTPSPPPGRRSSSSSARPPGARFPDQRPRRRGSHPRRGRSVRIPLRSSPASFSSSPHLNGIIGWYPPYFLALRKRAVMYQPTTRLLTILELLQARPQLSAAELARRLEVDGRTVRRYVTMLQDMGIPIQAVHGRYGGYRLRPGYKLPPLMFTAEEALAVALGLLAARW